MRTLLSVCEGEQASVLTQLSELVVCESPSTDRVALDLCAALMVAQLEASGATVRRVPAATTADHLVAEWPGDGVPVMLLGHYDTVWPVGQLTRMPLRQEGGKLFGPGVYDMKGGLAIGMLAMRAILQQVPVGQRPQVSMLVTADEEVGGTTSRGLIEQMARDHVSVLVLEPALRGGAVKTARKGVGEFELVAHGISSHAGADPGLGASAVHEIARQIVALESLRNPDRGISVNAGIVEGGSRGNVVAERARVVIDVRVSYLEDARAMTDAVHALTAHDPRIRLQVKGSIDRPPMERTPAVVRLYEMARAAAAEIDEVLEEGSTGGASDGNFTAALGVPTLDGLGPVGDGAHALHEHVELNSLPRRAAILAGTIRGQR